MYIADLRPNEGKIHLEAKNLLFEKIVDQNVKFIDQYNNTVLLPGYEFVSMESYLFRYSNGVEYFSSGACGNCGGGYEFEEDDDIFVDSRFKNRCEFNKNIYIIDQEKDIQAFYSHPCNMCEFKNQLHVSCIFDIGLVHEGYYSAAIEILNHSPSSVYKIDVCRKNNIPIIEVRAKDVLDYSKTGTIPCKRLWWYKEEEVGNLKIQL